MTAAQSSLTAIHTPDTTRLDSVLAASTARAFEWLRQTLCGLHGHAMMLHFESTRLSLHCANCGRKTQGWMVGARR